MNIQNLVGPLELLQRKIDTFLPDREIFRVAGLQLDQFVAHASRTAGIGGRAFRSSPCKSEPARQSDRARGRRDRADFSSHKSPSRTACPNRRYDCRGSTSCPRKDAMRASASPSTMLRICPTCIGLATFGEPKSITMRCGDVRARDTEAFVLQESRRAVAPRRPARRVKLMKPAPAIVGGSHRSRIRPDASMIFSRNRPRIFAALFRENERGIGLIIAETRIGRWRDSPAVGKSAAASASESFARAMFGKFP